MAEEKVQGQQQIILQNLLSFSVTSVEERLKKNFEVIINKLKELESCIGMPDKLRSFERETRNGMARLEAIIRSNQANREESLSRPKVQALIVAKINEVFKNLEENNFFTSAVLDSYRKKIQLTVLGKCRQITLQEVSYITLEKLMAKQVARPEQKLEDQGQQQSEAKQEAKEQTSAPQPAFNLEQLFKNNFKSQNQNKQQYLALKQRIRSMEMYLADKSFTKIVGRQFHVPEQTQPGEKAPEPKVQYRGSLVGGGEGTSAPAANDKLTKPSQPAKQEQKQQISPTKRLRQDNLLQNIDQDSELSRPKFIWRSVKKIVESAEVRARSSKLEKIEQQGSRTRRQDKREMVKDKVEIVGLLQKKFRMEEATMRSFDLKLEYNQLLKELDAKLDNKINRDTFAVFVEQMKDESDRLKAALPVQDFQELKRGLYYLDEKVNRLATAMTQGEGQDPMIVKKQWSCLSCERNIEKVAGKAVHANWELLPGKKISPTKTELGRSRRRANDEQIRLLQ